MAPGDLEPEARRQILEAVLDYPGLHLAEIARRTGLPLNLVDYHMEALLDTELVVDALFDGHRRFYPTPGTRGPEVADAEWLAMLREPVRLHAAFAVLNASGPVTHTAIAGEVGVAKSTLSFHLGKLVEVGMLERTRGGYIAKDRARLVRLLVAHRPVPELFATHFARWLPLYREATTMR